jgi:hypothetical protein
MKVQAPNDIENTMSPMSMSPTDEIDFVEYTEEDDDDDIAGRNSIADLSESIAYRRKRNGDIEPKKKTVRDRVQRGGERMLQALEYKDLHWTTKIFLVLLILPTAVICLLKQLRIFIVLALFNYTGFNIRSMLIFDIITERDIMKMEYKFKGGPLTLSKVMYVSQKYMTYWIVIILSMVALPFINEITFVQIIDRYNNFTNNDNVNYLLQLGISILIGFANLIPSSAVRPDISSFISSFTEQDYTIRDSPHTRLKDLSEVLEDIKSEGFALLHADAGSPIIVSTKDPEMLRELEGFSSLLSTDTFNSNQILRFIQIEEDVDSFFVLRNDIGMCQRFEHDPFRWASVWDDFINFKLRVEISELELNLYGGLSFVLLVGLFSATSHLPVSSILAAWALWPILFAVYCRRRRSKIASINFFTLDGKERKYQPFNNIVVSTDDVILNKIHEFKFFKALFKYCRQGKFLIHSLLKVTESVKYDWLELGLMVRDFKRLASLCVSIYELDVGIVTPNARRYYSAPRRANDMSVVFTVHYSGEVTAAKMSKSSFELAFNGLRNGDDVPSLENMFLH